MTVDHRRATAERNSAAIVDAAERLLARGAALNMRAIAAEAGVSRPTLYAHYATLADVVEAVVERAVDASVAAVEAAEPEAGPADAALERMLATSWGHLAGLDALARAAAEHLPAAARNRAHGALMRRARALVDRGRAAGTFRTDLPADWLVTALYALVHAADEHVREHGEDRERALNMLTTTVRDVFSAR